MMADNKRYIQNQSPDLRQILQEAQHRWLRPAEICQIIQNHHRFQLSQEPLTLPESGTVLLFNRKEVRYFRKDGHRWRKKKDGKTVKEAHEKLKSGCVDVLHCYYAHGEGNENFQRRSYWMLDKQLEHIVLVHYREVKEGYRSGIYRLVAETQTESPLTCSAPSPVYANSPALAVQASFPSMSKIYTNSQALSSEIEDVNSWDDSLMVSSPVQLGGRSTQQNLLLLESGLLGFSELASNSTNPLVAESKSGNCSELSMWNDTHKSNAFGVDGHNQKLYAELLNGADFINHKLTEARLHAPSGTVNSEDTLIDGTDDEVAINSSQRLPQITHEHDLTIPPIPNSFGSLVVVSFNNDNKSEDSSVNTGELRELRKLDSFGRWMDREIGQDCNDSLVASDSVKHWDTLDTETNNKAVSGLSPHMQLDVDSPGPSISQEQLFSILDFSPEWACTGVQTKVLIVGTFLGNKEQSFVSKWSCMFGEIEVPAELLTANVLRCQAPSHSPGRVPFYITCANRLACSEVREFEFREQDMVAGGSAKEDVYLQTRMAKFLCLGMEEWLYCANEDCVGCKVNSLVQSIRSDAAEDWEQMKESAVLKGDQINFKDSLIQNLLKDRLQEWLICKAHVGVKGPLILDGEGQGVIHLAAALGYEWAIKPIVAAGVNPNFRDARGRTALHWASYFGREETVTELIKLGASPGAVDDPTSKYPGGQTAADLASSRGHKGIAGYLAEADLSHLSALNVSRNVLQNADATEKSDKTIDFAGQYDAVADGQWSLKRSLAAVTKSARAASLIQACFRADSLRYRQLTKFEDDSSATAVDLVALGSLSKVRNVSHFKDYLHCAAVKIQQKYRGYKGRKDFLKIRSRIVKLQAHVRGHQVRKQYRKVVWSVSVVEKAILRWRRKSTGLRGFSVVNLTEDVAAGKEYEYEFLRVSRKQKFDGVEKALSRVRSMVRDSEAREQYMRLITRFGKLKVGDELGEGQQLNQSR